MAARWWARPGSGRHKDRHRLRRGVSVGGGCRSELKDVIEVLDREPLLPPDVVALCQWVADYYLAGIGDAIGAALPPGARRKATSFKTRRVAAVTALGAEPSSLSVSTGVTAKTA